MYIYLITDTRILTHIRWSMKWASLIVVVNDKKVFRVCCNSDVSIIIRALTLEQLVARLGTVAAPQGHDNIMPYRVCTNSLQYWSMQICVNIAKSEDNATLLCPRSCDKWRDTVMRMRIIHMRIISDYSFELFISLNNCFIVHCASDLMSSFQF